MIVSFLPHLFFYNHTNCWRTEVDSCWFTQGSLVESSHIQESPRKATTSKSQQSPWGVDLKLEPNHRRNFDDVVVFSFFTTNKQTDTYEYYTLARVWFFSDYTGCTPCLQSISWVQACWPLADPVESESSGLWQIPKIGFLYKATYTNCLLIDLD